LCLRAIAWLKLPLLWVLLALGGLGWALAYRRMRNDGGTIAMGLADWLSLLGHYMALSLLCVGGAITTAPDMHRFLVQEKGWLTDPAVQRLDRHRAGGARTERAVHRPHGLERRPERGRLPTALLGMLLCLGGIMLPSSVLAYDGAQWSHRNRDLRAVRAFKQGMAPVVIALLVATGWILATANGYEVKNWPTWAVTLVTTLVVWRTRLHLLWLLGAGGVDWRGARLGLRPSAGSRRTRSCRSRRPRNTPSSPPDPRRS
jgi:chromate transporter